MNNMMGTNNNFSGNYPQNFRMNMPNCNFLNPKTNYQQNTKLSLNSEPNQNKNSNQENSNNKNLEEEKKKLTKELNDEKEKVKKLNKELSEEKEKVLKLTKELNKEKEKVENLNKDLKILEQKLSTNDIDYKKILQKKDNEIEELRIKMNNLNFEQIKPGEKIFSINFISEDNKISNYSLTCKNTDTFVKIEQMLYEDFPEYKNKETYFKVNNRTIRRFLTIDENNIGRNEVVKLFVRAE
jgi:hypothetical protein